MIAWLGLGGNLGPVRATLARALRELDQGPCRVQAVSSLWLTRPVGPADQPDFLNAAARLAVALGPGALLERLKELERRLGRQSRPHWRERELDLDLLLALEDGPLLVAGARLALPHPGLCQRAFVLEPLLELDPDLRDPRDGHELSLDVRRLRAQEPDAVRRMEDPGWCRS
ncbi:MAG: 2-amino-4-hydroxy-6-hydroxymethyldihydropteridine diphosphokinase [Candidatus Delongbacteria bacterium]